MFSNLPHLYSPILSYSIANAPFESPVYVYTFGYVIFWWVAYEGSSLKRSVFLLSLFVKLKHTLCLRVYSFGSILFFAVRASGSMKVMNHISFPGNFLFKMQEIWDMFCKHIYYLT